MELSYNLDISWLNHYICVTSVPQSFGILSFLDLVFMSQGYFWLNIKPISWQHKFFS